MTKIDEYSFDLADLDKHTYISTISAIAPVTVRQLEALIRISEVNVRL